MSEMERHERIEAYLLGELSEAERLAFEEEMQKDEALKAEVEQAEAVHKLVVQESRQELKSRLHEIREEGPPAKPLRSGFSRPLAIAATVVVLLVSAMALYFLLNNTSDEGLYAKYYEPHPNMLTTMGEQNPDQSLILAMDQYDQGNYQAALEHFQDYPEDGPYSIQVKLYTGVSYLELDQPEEALVVFSSFDHNNQFLFNHLFLWYEALTQLRLENYSACRKLLDQLEAVGGASKYVELATELKKELPDQ